MRVGFSYKRDGEDLYTVNIDAEMIREIVVIIEGRVDMLVSKLEYEEAFRLLECRHKLTALLEEVGDE